MKLVADVDTITSNLNPLSAEIDSFSSAVSSFNGSSINCPVEEVSGVLDSYKSSISDDLNKLNTSSGEYKTLVSECCSEYKANEANTQTIDVSVIKEIIKNSEEVVKDYKGNAASRLTGLPSTEIRGTASIEAQKILDKYEGRSIPDLSNDEFLEYIAAAAQIDYEESGILPSVTIAQAICESAWGDCAIGNNLFGIKCGDGWTGKRQTLGTSEQTSGGDYYNITADFRDYDTLNEGIKDHSDLLNNDRYTPVRQACDNNDPYEACRQLSSCGYATSLTYADTLISIIEYNDLTRFDP